jgi:Polyketide cyclase / dehydrase and lipid transport
VALIVCPTTVVAAPIATIWPLLANPQTYDGWADAELVRAQPTGSVSEGHVIEMRTHRLGRWWRVRFDVGRVQPERSIEMTIHLPFGTINHEQIVLTPVDPERTRVTFN